MISRLELLTRVLDLARRARQAHTGTAPTVLVTECQALEAALDEIEALLATDVQNVQAGRLARRQHGEDRHGE